ncbi:hypothetical protein DFJ77DRAFT_264747 [Powellomyces hirtus]|nr:hypothetical protein DFJ77DRAFT_264747 [Powellomyces hirtus]
MVVSAPLVEEFPLSLSDSSQAIPSSIASRSQPLQPELAPSHLPPECNQISCPLATVLNEKDEELRLAAEYGLDLLKRCNALEQRNVELELLVATCHKDDGVPGRRSAGQEDHHLRILEARCAQLLCELESKEQHIAGLNRELNKARGEIARKTDIEASIDELISDLVGAQRREIDTRRENAKLQAELAMIEMDSKAADRSLPDEAVEHLELDSQTEVEVLFALATELQTANTKLRQDLETVDALRFKNEKLTHDLHETETLLSQLRNELSSAKTQSELASDPIAIQGTRSLNPRKSVFGELEDVVRNTPPSYVWPSKPADSGFESRDGSECGASASPRFSLFPQQQPSMTPLLEHLHDLTQLGTDLHRKLTSTDPHCLNRTLRQRFDLAQLSELSQTVIDNIAADVQDLPQKFPILFTKSPGPIPTKSATYSPLKWHADSFLPVFLPLVRLVQSLLEELCRVKGTLNDYALMYFQKISQKAAGASVVLQPSPLYPPPQQRQETGVDRVLLHQQGLIAMPLQNALREHSVPSLWLPGTIPGQLLERQPMPGISPSPATVASWHWSSATSPQAESASTTLLADLPTGRLSISDILPSAQTIASWFNPSRKFAQNHPSE